MSDTNSLQTSSIVSAVGDYVVAITVTGSRGGTGTANVIVNVFY